MLIKIEDIYYGLLCWYTKNLKIRENLKKQIRKSSICFYRLMVDMNEICAIKRDETMGVNYNAEKVKFFYLMYLVVGTLYSANRARIPKVSPELADNVISNLEFTVSQERYKFIKKQIQKLSPPFYEIIEELFSRRGVSLVSRICIYSLAGVFITAVRAEAERKRSEKVVPSAKPKACVVSLDERRKK